MHAKQFAVAALVAAFVSVVPATTRAAPDPDGVADAIVSTPYKVIGDVMGGFGLLVGGVSGFAGDLVAIVDDNEYSRILLRGVFSKLFYRMGQTMSQGMTGAMEGGRSENFDAFPEAATLYSNQGLDNMEGRIGSLQGGVGAVVLGVADLVTGVPMILTRGIGVDALNQPLEDCGPAARDMLVGTAKPQ